MVEKKHTIAKQSYNWTMIGLTFVVLYLIRWLGGQALSSGLLGPPLH